MKGLFLSRARFRLAQERGRRARGATSAYVVHQFVADLFGQYERRPFLYRIDDHDGHSRTALILSQRPPQPSGTNPDESLGSLQSLETKSFDPAVPAGTRLDFEVRVNATKDVRQENGNTRRTDVWEAVWQQDRETEQTPDATYRDYLIRKLDGAARVESTHVVERGLVRARANLNRRAITFVATNLIGSLMVEDGGRLRHVVARGIGRSKAFGCGLMCLSRPGTILPRRYPEHLR